MAIFNLKKLVIIVIILLSSFFVFFYKAPHEVYADEPTPEEISRSLDNNSNCGGITQACCSDRVVLPKIRVAKSIPNFAGLGKIIGILVSPLDIVLRQSDPIIDFVQDHLSPDSISWFHRPACHDGIASNSTDLGNCTCLRKEAFNINKLCLNIEDQNEKNECIKCVGVWTAIGCVNSRVEDFITQKIFGIGVGIAGTVSLLCIVYAAFVLQTSAGNPERIKKAREYLTNCILGLILIIGSVFILQIIGVSILRIPGFQ